MRTKKYLALLLAAVVTLSAISVNGMLAGAAEATRTPITASNVPTDTSLIAGKTPTKADGSAATALNGKLEYMTDGGMQGIQDKVMYAITNDANEKWRAYPNGGTPGYYYSFLAPEALVLAHGKNTADGPWYIKPANALYMATTSNDSQAELVDSNRKIVYNMGAMSTVESVLIASSTPITAGALQQKAENWYAGDAYDVTRHQTLTNWNVAPLTYGSAMLEKVKVYVGNTVDVFTSGTCVLQFDLSASTADALRNLWTLPESVDGQYIGFDFSECNGNVGVSELAVYGEAGQASPPALDWSGATAATKGQYMAATEVPTGSLIAGKLPTKDTLTTGWSPMADSEPLSCLTDGQFVDANNNGRVTLELRFGASKVEENDWANMTFDMGEVYNVTHALIGSEYGSPQYLKNARMYVSESLDTLYTTDSLVMEGANITMGNYFIKGEAKQGRYVGLSFLYPGANAPWYGQMRIGELAVYGDTVTIPPDPGPGPGPDPGPNPTPDWQDATKGQYMAATEVPTGSLIAGKLPTKDTLTTGFALVAGGGELSYLTDGQFVDADNNGRAVIELRFGTSKVEPGEWANMTFKLDGLYNVTHALIGSEYGSPQYLKNVRLYVSERLDSLYTADSLVMEGADIDLGNYFIKGEAKQGRYVGLSFLYPGADAPWYGHMRIGELAVYGDLLEPQSGLDWSSSTITTKGEYLPTDTMDSDSLLLDVYPTQGTGDGNWKIASGEMGYISDGELVKTDNSNRLVVDLRGGIVPAGEWACFTFESAVIADFTHFLIGSESGVAQRLENVRIYVSDKKATLYDEANLVAEVTDSIANNYYVRGEKKNGQYVGFAFKNPGGDREAPWYGQIRFGELAAYGVVTNDNPNGAKMVTLTAEETAKLPTDRNLLVGNAPIGVNGLALSVTDMTQSTDGVVPLMTPVTAGNGATVTTDGTVVYDLGVETEIKNILIASANEAPLGKVSVYMSDILPDLYNKSPLTANLEGKAAGLCVFTQTRTARYIAFKVTMDEAWNGTVKLGEVGVYGIYRAEPATNVNLILGKQPVDYYFSEVQIPDRYHADNNGYLGELAFSDPIENLTDGDITTRSAFTHRVTDGRLPGSSDRYYISPETPWGVLVFYLGGTATVNEILLTSTGEGGDYFVGGADYYVGQNLDTLFDAANRVHTTGGEKTYMTPQGAVKLDPATDVTERCIRAVLDTPKQGRYVAVVITRPTSTDRLGYSISRIDELSVYGHLPADKVEVMPEDTYTDSTYGYTLTLTRLNYDDVAIYDTIDHLEVVRTPYPDTMPKLVCDNWLTVDPAENYIYEFRLVKKDGQVLTVEECGDRTIDVKMDNKTGRMQGLGSIMADNTVQRVINSRTDAKGVLLGENTGSFKLVKLVFDDSMVIASGVAGDDLAVTAGATTESGVSAAWWLLMAVPVAAMAVLLMWWTKRRRIQ